jgi:hypothetical protein
VDGDDGPCHATSLGIPAYVIADLEPPGHLADSLFLPEAPLSIQLRHGAPRHVHCRRG